MCDYRDDYDVDEVDGVDEDEDMGKSLSEVRENVYKEWVRLNRKEVDLYGDYRDVLNVVRGEGCCEGVRNGEVFRKIDEVWSVMFDRKLEMRVILYKGRCLIDEGEVMIGCDYDKKGVCKRCYGKSEDMKERGDENSMLWVGVRGNICEMCGSDEVRNVKVVYENEDRYSYNGDKKMYEGWSRECKMCGYVYDGDFERMKGDIKYRDVNDCELRGRMFDELNKRKMESCERWNGKRWVEYR